MVRFSMGATMRTSAIRKEVNPNLNEADIMYVVELYEDGELVEMRALPNKSIHYANDVSENWNNGIIHQRAGYSKNDK